MVAVPPAFRLLEGVKTLVICHCECVKTNPNKDKWRAGCVYWGWVRGVAFKGQMGLDAKWGPQFDSSLFFNCIASGMGEGIRDCGIII